MSSLTAITLNPGYRKMLLSIRNLSKLAFASIVLLLAGCSGGVLDPKGQVGIEEKCFKFFFMAFQRSVSVEKNMKLTANPPLP